MGLKDLTFGLRVLKTPGGDVTVRGASTDDIAILIRRNDTAAHDLFDLVVGENASLSDPAGIAAAMVQRAPDLVADLIALACKDADESIEESIGVAKNLPFPVQLALLEAIGEETFAMEGGMGKVVETVIRILQETSTLVGSLKDSKTGSEVSSAK